ncbi:MAG TPA: hypothetical protein VJ084_00265, partial [Nitrospinota bacterium]|nr:hypothetical protein [Nitrospinota bacterium]
MVMVREIALRYSEVSLLPAIRTYLIVLKLRIGVVVAFSAVAGYFITADKGEFSLFKLFILALMTMTASAGAGAF